MNMIPHIFIPLSIGVIAFVIAFFKHPRWAIMGFIITKPVVDLTWDYFLVYDINFLKVFSGLYVALCTIYLVSYRPRLPQLSISVNWIIFLCLNVLSIFVMSKSYLFLDKMDYFLRIATGFVTFYIFAHLFQSSTAKRSVVLAFIISAAIPMLFWLIPLLLGFQIYSNDPLGRIIGPYHRFWHFNFYGLQGMICCMVYLALQKNDHSLSSRLHNGVESVIQYVRNMIVHKTVFLYLLIGLSISMIYTCYTKAGWVILIVVFLMWFSFKKKFVVSILLIVGVIVLMTVSPFTNEFRKTFDNEIEYFLQGTATKESVFRGRLVQWELGMVKFRNQKVANLLFGAKEPLAFAENDYLRVLWDNGIIGFLVFLILLGQTGFLVLRKYCESKSPIALAGLIVLVVYLLSSIGSYPMLYPAFQWFMWGTIGFAQPLYSSSCKEYDL